ncbi:TPA: DUF87 domain-containing protein [Legionella pneumophila subsp. pneumophila]|uniref:ATP-binding protein n=1 Tax=Legionella pneumophila TaxID=446 RepID=UPI000770B5A2|nr:ATP-binding protein [Legionella pneumophila]HAT9216350.1 DUF87 domain-containing protein [Legionella pneumophila subsp. pneumophila]CZI17239.1 Type IV secretory pathway%2C VirB4 components [Legionella pneumophila]HAT9262455.1 DUF87 domain-containing protein [Legionella pneumophila subsp. pneumophila]HAT9283871.1 DUF87 domain-containing protein [Legionella pneumophila subsp. pneumophila]HAT9289929.1 DUF87 domain-containing protein [Legionella pneumophila subsp. pneumophila]
MIFIKNIFYLLKNRFVILIIFFMVTILIQYVAYHTWLPSTDNKDLWFYSGIFMVLFSILFIEPYYSSPKNVITNSIPLMLVFLSIKSSFTNLLFWWFAFSVLLGLVILSVIAMTLEDKEQSPECGKNIFSKMIKNIVVIIGQGKILYSAVFLYFLLTYYSIQDLYTLTLFILWSVILCINPKSIHNNFSTELKKKEKDQLGNIFSVQSQKIFLVKLYDDKKNISKFDLVIFRHSMQTKNNSIMIGMVFDIYLLDQQRWAKILQMEEEYNEFSSLKDNIVYKVNDKLEIERLSQKLKINDFSGIVIEGSTIGKIKFEYSKMKDNLQEGDLLELKIENKKLLYQVIGGSTEYEKIEDRNEIGFIEGEATQLGEWQNEKVSFQKFGWVPSINTPIFKASAPDINVGEIKYPNYKLGTIPDTSLPSVINLHEAVSHHLALLGITGSGKSFIARELINAMKVDTKIICIDFNKEFTSTLESPPSNIIKEANANKIAEKIKVVNTELEKFANQQDKNKVEENQNEIKKIIRKEINEFLDDDHNITVFELTDIVNTTNILDYTKYFFSVLFEIAKERLISGLPKRICVVLEEAHTIIPEWNFAGSSDKSSQSLVNSIGQIALQGRKYEIGFLVIAQRTANVSKTILTQCNTVICFQAYDETSFSFLGNYVGKDLVQVLPNLKQYHAVVAGKAIKSNMPMIIDLSRLNS